MVKKQPYQFLWKTLCTLSSLLLQPFYLLLQLRAQRKRANQMQHLLPIILIVFILLVFIWILTSWVRNADPSVDGDICQGSIALNQVLEDTSFNILGVPIICEQSEQVVNIRSKEQIGQRFASLVDKCWTTYGSNNDDRLVNSFWPEHARPTCWPCYALSI